MFTHLVMHMPEIDLALHAVTTVSAHANDVLADGYNPGDFIPKNKPEGSEGVVALGKLLIGYARLIGIISSMVIILIFLPLAWWNEKKRDKRMNVVKGAFVTLLVLFLIEPVLKFVIGLVGTMIRTLNGG